MSEDTVNTTKMAELGMYKVFELLKEHDNNLSLIELFDLLEKEDFIKKFYEYKDKKKLKTTPFINLSWYSCGKNNYLEKNRKQWIITEEGKELFDKHKGDTSGFFREYLSNSYGNNDNKIISGNEDEKKIEKAQEQNLLLNKEQEVQNDIKELLNELAKIDEKTTRNFEKMCKALLTAMGYIVLSNECDKTSCDGGIDIVASKDEFGLSGRLICQCKKWNNTKVDIKEIRALGFVKGSNEGIFFTTSGFTKPAIEEAKKNNIRMINGEEFKEI